MKLRDFRRMVHDAMGEEPDGGPDKFSRWDELHEMVAGFSPDDPDHPYNVRFYEVVADVTETVALRAMELNLLAVDWADTDAVNELQSIVESELLREYHLNALEEIHGGWHVAHAFLGNHAGPAAVLGQ